MKAAFAIAPAVALACAGALWTAPAIAATASFAPSCTGVSLTVTPDKVVLNARCNRLGREAPKKSSIELKGIINAPEGLKIVAEPSSSFQKSCTGIAYSQVANTPKITATCADGKGGTRPASITLQNIDNIDGVQKYAR